MGRDILSSHSLVLEVYEEPQSPGIAVQLHAHHIPFAKGHAPGLRHTPCQTLPTRVPAGLPTRRIRWRDERGREKAQCR